MKKQKPLELGNSWWSKASRTVLSRDLGTSVKEISFRKLNLNHLEMIYLCMPCPCNSEKALNDLEVELGHL